MLESSETHKGVCAMCYTAPACIRAARCQRDNRPCIVPKPFVRQARVHNVRSWSHFFQAIKAGVKTHDLRKNDRGYQVGDHLLLHEYNNIDGCTTGERICVEITYITDNNHPCAFSSAVLDRAYCILSIKRKA